MTEKQIQTQWTLTVKITLIALILNILAIVYMGVIQNQQMKSTIINHTEEFIKVDAELKRLQKEKVDYSYMDLILQGQTEIKQSMNLNNQLLIKHITGLN